ncbi:tetratricopeptide repeat protein [Frondihabitans sp. 4ASC-45]|uniref:hypothetical protein n=1 Tax=Frondihabitans sp. 4ASC-45 TaxID=3111636 RepID=UPI003C1C2F7C
MALDQILAKRQAIELLSAVPYFDFDTGVDVVTLIQERLDVTVSSKWAADYLFELAAAGILEPVKDLLRVPELVRDSMLEAVRQRDDNLIAEALEIYTKNAQGQLGSALQAIVGPRGTRVLLESLAVIAAPEDSTRFDQLIETVHRSSRLGRPHDSASAAVLLRRFSSADDRSLMFIEGLSLWQAGKRREAAPLFEGVLKTKYRDKAEGIAAHLLGVQAHESGRTQALQLFRRAEAALQRTHDNRGLAITRSSHGRVLRDLARSESNPERLTESLSQYRRAETSLEKTPADDSADYAKSLGRIHLGMAQTYFDQGDHPAALEYGRRALDAFGSASDEKLFARTVLAQFYKDLDRIPEVLDVLNEKVIGTGGIVSRRDEPAALALNVLASIQRRNRDLPAARRNAKLSVSIGENLGIRKHIAHSLVTLARIEIDLLPADISWDDRKVRNIRSLLHRSQGASGPRHDVRRAVDELLLLLPQFSDHEQAATYTGPAKIAAAEGVSQPGTDGDTDEGRGVPAD